MARMVAQVESRNSQLIYVWKAEQSAMLPRGDDRQFRSSGKPSRSLRGRLRNSWVLSGRESEVKRENMVKTA
jgi:hypothetical protein